MSCERIVQRAAANLPQSATGTLFTVSGGSVLVTAVVGEITTALQNVANTGTLSIGSGVVLWAFSLDNIATGMVLGADSPSVLASATRIVPDVPVAAGSGTNITLQCSASITGQIAWALVYQPLDPGAVVTAV